MGEARRTNGRWTTIAGLLCLLGTLLLSSTGVRTVRAEAGEEALMSIDPKLEASLEASPPVQPAPPPLAKAPSAQAELRPGEPAAETQPGVIVLNTRGYNYGPPAGPIDPAALDHEAPPARPAP